MSKQLNIGILSLQGDFAEHAAKLRELGCIATEVRRSSELEGLDGLIIPGGESTTNAILEDAISKIESHMPILPNAHTPIFDAIKEKVKSASLFGGHAWEAFCLQKKLKIQSKDELG